MWETFNLEKSKKIVKIAIIFSIIVLVFLFIGIFTLNKPSQPKEISRQDLILNLPYITEDYSISYSTKKDQIYVNVKDPYEQNRQKALEWIKSQGADPSKLNIFYTPSSKFKELNKR
ncbi:hypothetical protein A2696_01540 [Candidatus Curtissbacteria bacterium RIFCSPHIGHO2_01_FULL_41_13]|uniref:Uncharacterized protein n=1 Tax=Candidatus Curtissbacteria bacterium RIFCSPHIGHO2_01_FULL_41_13 TaxID=1797745 RepID=A0A1F5FYG5_9BACT|nr:MAG: hypothetical protein A2696_01540 [Candidatus Curtissbacteria bacterium RIFCSPHIGHO2_01_FULL_41_13]